MIRRLIVLSCFIPSSVFGTAIQADSSYRVVEEKSWEEEDQAKLEILVSDTREMIPGGRLLPVQVYITASDGSHPDGSGHGVYKNGRFCAEGQFSITAPPGQTKVKISSGPNYIPLEFSLNVRAGVHTKIEVGLHQWFAPESLGWYSGDNHVHAQHDESAVIATSLEYTALQGRANGLNFITEAGSNVAYDEIDSLDTDSFKLRFAQELRPACFTGHFITPGILRPINSSEEAKISAGPLHSQIVSEIVQRLGGIATYTHPLRPTHQLHWMGAASIFADAVMGRCADLMDMDTPQTQLLWFSALNMGNRIGCSSYTDCGLGRVSSGPPGGRRVYCQADDFTYHDLVRAMRAQRTFATNGGALFPFFNINGVGPGGTITLEDGETYTATIDIQSLHTLRSATLFKNGRVEKAFDVTGKKGAVTLSAKLEPTEKSWFVFKVEDDHEKWAITSPIYLNPARPDPYRPAHSLILELSNNTRFIELRKDFFAHMLVTLSPGQSLASVALLKDGVAEKRFTPAEGDQIRSNNTPATGRGGVYESGWQWHYEGTLPVHFQADWAIKESGWYVIEAVTDTGHKYYTDALRFESANPNSHEITVANMGNDKTSFTLWGYGEEMPLADIQLPFKGDHWWYPHNSFWRVEAVFNGDAQVLSDGDKTIGVNRFKSTAPFDPG